MLIVLVVLSLFVESFEFVAVAVTVITWLAESVLDPVKVALPSEFVTREAQSVELTAVPSTAVMAQVTSYSTLSWLLFTVAVKSAVPVAEI